MRQTSLDLPSSPAFVPAPALGRRPPAPPKAACPPADRDPACPTGFQIGWDHAHHGLVPPATQLQGHTPVAQGWLAGRAVFGTRTLAATRWVRQWLQLRLQAWAEGMAFDELQVTPHYLAQIHTERCPVLRQPLGGAAGDPLAAVVERLNPAAGYAAGNLAVMSLAAAQARAGLSVQDLVRRARQAELQAGLQPASPAAEPASGTTPSLTAAAWWRLAALAGFVLPPQALPFHLAAQLPLAVLPPNRVRVLGAAQGLQALLTQMFLRPGWAGRARLLAARLPAHSLRHDFNLFVGAMAPRLLEASTHPADPRQAVEDAWLHERVQRRWQHFVLSLGEPACEQLLAQAAATGLAGVRTCTYAPEQAVEGWGLQPGGEAAGSPQPISWRRPAPPRRRQPPAAAQADLRLAAATDGMAWSGDTAALGRNRPA